MDKRPRLIPELKVSDFLLSLDFYTRLAGFEILYGRPEEHFAMLSKNRAQIMIEELGGNSRDWIAGPLEKPYGKGMNLQVSVGDADSLYYKFLDQNYPIFHEIEIKSYRMNERIISQKQFLVQDPDGYLLRFCQYLSEDSSDA